MKLPEKALTWGLILLLLALIIATIILGSVPPVDRDALTHHLFVPKLWLKHGGIYEIPEIPFSYYPMNLDLLYTIPLYFGNDIIPKYIHYFFALLTALLLYRHLKKRLGVEYGLFGALFFLSVPIIVKLSITVYVDLGLMFFTTASLLLLLHWVQQFKARFLLLAGLCCGLAAGVKYNGLIGIFLLILFVPVLYQQFTRRERQSNFKALLFGALFATTTLAAFSPWLIKNSIWTGNPIYPLHNSFFQTYSPFSSGQTRLNEVSEDSNRGNNALGSSDLASRKILYQETWWQAFLLPVRYFYEGQDDNPRYFDGKLNLFLLLLPFFAFMKKSAEPKVIHKEKQILSGFAILFFFLTFFLQPLRIRYIVCVVPILTILSVFGFHNIFTTISAIRHDGLQRTFRVLAIAIPFIYMAYNTNYILHQFQIVQPFSYLSGTIDREKYISRFRPEFPAIQFTNNDPQTTKTLAIFLGNRGYYFDKPVQFDLNNGISFLCEIVKHSKNEKQIAEALQRENISHLLIRHDLFEQWIRDHLDSEEIKRLNLFFQDRTLLSYEKNGHGVFQLKQTPKSQQPVPFPLRRVEQ